MKFIADIGTKTWSFDKEYLSTDIQIKFGFRNNGKLPVFFDQMTFGYSLTSDSKKISENSRPQPGMSYIFTDQDYIELFNIYQLIVGKKYTLEIWVKNGGDLWKESINFIPLFSPQPYPSWTLDEETRMWAPPISYPEDNNLYSWNEETQSWILFELP